MPSRAGRPLGSPEPRRAPVQVRLGRSSSYSTLIPSIYAYGGNRPPQAIKGDLPHPSLVFRGATLQRQRASSLVFRIKEESEE